MEPVLSSSLAGAPWLQTRPSLDLLRQRVQHDGPSRAVHNAHRTRSAVLCTLEMPRYNDIWSMPHGSPSPRPPPSTKAPKKKLPERAYFGDSAMQEQEDQHTRQATSGLATSSRPADRVNSRGSWVGEGYVRYVEDLDDFFALPSVEKEAPPGEKEHRRDRRRMDYSSDLIAAANAATQFREMVMEDLRTFVSHHAIALRGYMPTREYLCDAGRTDLVRAIRRLGGPLVVATALGLRWSANIMDEVAESTSGVCPHLPTSHSRSRGSGSKKPSVGAVKCRKHTATTSAVSFTPQHFTPPTTVETILRCVQACIDQGLVFMVEHHRTMGATDHFWTLWRLPLYSAHTADAVMVEANSCAEQYPDHFVRLTAYDIGRQAQQVSYLIHKPDVMDATVEVAATKGLPGSPTTPMSPAMAIMDQQTKSRKDALEAQQAERRREAESAAIVDAAASTTARAAEKLAYDSAGSPPSPTDENGLYGGTIFANRRLLLHGNKQRRKRRRNGLLP
eukprot:jgi/Chlat1/7821/Chrsp66S07265